MEKINHLSLIYTRNNFHFATFGVVAEGNNCLPHGRFHRLYLLSHCTNAAHIPCEHTVQTNVV